MPYDAPEPYRSMYLDSGMEITARIDSGCRYPEALLNKTLVLNEEERSAVVDIYDGCLTYLDAKVGELFADLIKKGIYDRTLIIVASDHGEVFGEYGYFGHGALLNRPLIHIPLVIRHPEIVSEPEVKEELVSISDIFHTLVKLLGLEGAPSTGATVRNLLDAEIPDGPCYSQLVLGRAARVEMLHQHDTRSVWAVDNLHYIYCEEEVHECFDLNRDFEEEHNLCPDQVSKEEVIGAVQGVEDLLVKFVELPGDLRITRRQRVDPQQERAMRALGYVGGDEEQDKIMVQEHPHVQEHLKTGIFFLTRGSLDEAEKELRTAFSMSPTNHMIRKYLGILHIKREEYGEAIRVLRSILNRKDMEAAVRLLLSQCYAATGKKDLAIKEIRKVAKLDFNDPEAALKAGAYSMAVGDYETAQIYFDRILKNDSQRSDLARKIVELYRHYEKWELAREALHKIIEVEPSLWSSLRLIQVCVKLKRYEEVQQNLVKLQSMKVPSEVKDWARQQLSALQSR